MFRIVKGGIEELSDDLKNKAAGIRTFPTGFEALMKIMSNILKSAKLDIALVKPYFKTICFKYNFKYIVHKFFIYMDTFYNLFYSFYFFSI